MMRSDRQWMYVRLKEGLLNPEFIDGVKQFIEFACNRPELMDVDRMRCPCNHRKCQNHIFLDVDTVKLHLYKNGFVPDYYKWTLHGEIDILQEESIAVDNNESSNPYHTMVFDAAGPEFNPNDMEESPNADAQKFYGMLKAADQDLWPGCKQHSLLSLVARVMNMKSEHNMSERNFDDMVQLMKEISPDDNRVPETFYGAKKLVQGMGLPVKKIHCCDNGCMIYWGDDSELTSCKFC